MTKYTKDRQYHDQIYEGQTIPKEEQQNKQWSTKHYTDNYRSNKKGVNQGAPEGLSSPAPLVTLIVLLIDGTNIIWYGNRAWHRYT
jgi:hypothetical protein